MQDVITYIRTILYYGEFFPLVKKGDSAVVVLMVDTLNESQRRQLPFMKKGDRLMTTIRVLEVFRNDSRCHGRSPGRNGKRQPRQMKEQEEQE